ncbi:hypothetical protein [Aurantiacibacter gangjinensis]|uniref:Uncharacterized protein n=1 Tax=Aurantiacibacter gangjinensis TaxID=502682 RepID=A0A0G9MNX2_9SPHN|nr:hypothetical protein [Aurantiacibacter gangjinensis]APE28253.1 hypothetical protein BMF35_a1424 [Aurantiacibacter gangjinensis]KLE31013.1 hypothetical protein AAW01_13280 [Aurantiacibacter gangjinensis]
MKRKFLIVFGVLLALLAVAAFTIYWTSPNRHTTPSQSDGLEWSYADGVLSSPARPSLAMRIDPSLDYLGGQKFVLYGTANVEQHVFARRWPDGRDRSMLLIQFESVVDGVDWAYDYSAAEYRTEIDGVDFFTDAEPGQLPPIFAKGEPGTDSYRAAVLAADAGFEAPEDYVWLRSVHIPDADARSELLIILRDDLSSEGVTRGELLPGGSAHDRWQAIAASRMAAVDGMISFPAEEGAASEP